MPVTGILCSPLARAILCAAQSKRRVSTQRRSSSSVSRLAGASFSRTLMALAINSLIPYMFPLHTTPKSVSWPEMQHCNSSQFEIRAFKNAFGSVGNPACPSDNNRQAAPSLHHVFFVLRCEGVVCISLNDFSIIHGTQMITKKDLSAAKHTTQLKEREMRPSPPSLNYHVQAQEFLP